MAVNKIDLRTQPAKDLTPYNIPKGFIPISLLEFMEKYKLKNEATSNTKIEKVIKKLNIKNCKFYLGNDKFTTEKGIVNLHPTKGTHFVLFGNGNYFDSYGVRPSRNIEKQLKKPILYSTYDVQKLNSDDRRCASYCLYILYLLNNGFEFKDAVVHLYLLSSKINDNR